ncbi:tRNA (N6-threonylcarbamoyladenosine(37)-N6)-methyltransferase TrmO [uncultured Methanocorpusculum sp.]|nr:tRNA (N6-threonylcarbamoyladenosine(37)-N6)-methyltransferase TrmO [uncultured Methanocorpusculum sp.]
MNCVPIGFVSSPFKTREDAPKQGRHTDKLSIITLEPAYQEAAEGLFIGDDLFIFCWFDRSDRTVLKSRRPGEEQNPPRGIFSNRSPNRPNPIALTLVKLVDIEGRILTVKGLEALDQTPVVDIKPYSEGIDTPRNG